MARVAEYPQYKDEYLRFREVFDAIRGLPKLSSSFKVDLGSFVLTGGEVYDSTGGNRFAGHALESVVDKFNQIGALVPLLNDPVRVVKMAMGYNISVYHLVLPQFSVGFGISGSTDIPSGLPGLNYTITGSIYAELSARATFGCDLTGLYGGKILNGFYVNNVGADVHVEVSASAGAEIDLLGYELGEVGVRGSFTANLSLDLVGEGGASKIYYDDLGSVSSLRVATGPFYYELKAYAEYRKYVFAGPWIENTRRLARGKIAL